HPDCYSHCQHYRPECPPHRGHPGRLPCLGGRRGAWPPVPAELVRRSVVRIVVTPHSVVAWSRVQPFSFVEARIGVVSDTRRVVTEVRRVVTEVRRVVTEARRGVERLCWEARFDLAVR